MKSIIIVLFIVGCLFLVIGYVNQIKKCPPPKIEYRYIPRTFKEEQDNPVKVSQLYSQMFEDPSPWVGGLAIGGNTSRDSEINQFKIN